MAREVTVGGIRLSSLSHALGIFEFMGRRAETEGKEVTELAELAARLDGFEERLAWLEGLCAMAPTVITAHLDELTSVASELRQIVAAVR